MYPEHGRSRNETNNTTITMKGHKNMSKNWIGKIILKIDYEPHVIGFVPIVDEETNGSNFYEEVQFKQRAELIVDAWNRLHDPDYISELE